MSEQRDSDLATALRLLNDLRDGSPCWFGHHGGCQEHGYLELEAGELCPHEETRQFLAHLDEAGKASPGFPIVVSAQAPEGQVIMVDTTESAPGEPPSWSQPGGAARLDVADETE